jgi:glutaredoxin
MINRLVRKYSAKAKAINVELFSKRHCGICQGVLEDLEEIRKRLPFDLQVIDIEEKRNFNWKELYFNDIPVIHIDKEPFVKHGIDKDEFEAELRIKYKQL